MNRHYLFHCILTIFIILSFNACGEAVDSVPVEKTTETATSVEQSIPSENDATVSSETISSDYVLPDETTVVKDSTILTTITTVDNNSTSVADGNLSTDDNTTTDQNQTVDENITTAIIEYTAGFVGELVDSKTSGVSYNCDGSTSVTDSRGYFNCSTTPISFSIGNISLGSLTSMTGDFLVFPQDLLGLQRGSALHPDVTKIAILFQSLDEDADPENGIIIQASTIELLNQNILQITSIQDIALDELVLAIEQTIALVLDQDPASRLQLVTSKQAQDHLLTTLSTILISPEQP